MLRDATFSTCLRVSTSSSRDIRVNCLIKEIIGCRIFTLYTKNFNFRAKDFPLALIRIYMLCLFDIIWSWFDLFRKTPQLGGGYNNCFTMLEWIGFLHYKLEEVSITWLWPEYTPRSCFIGDISILGSVISIFHGTWFFRGKGCKLVVRGNQVRRHFLSLYPSPPCAVKLISRHWGSFYSLNELWVGTLWCQIFNKVKGILRRWHFINAILV